PRRRLDAAVLSGWQLVDVRDDRWQSLSVENLPAGRDEQERHEVIAWQSLHELSETHPAALTRTGAPLAERQVAVAPGVEHRIIIDRDPRSGRPVACRLAGEAHDVLAAGPFQRLARAHDCLRQLSGEAGEDTEARRHERSLTRRDVELPAD